MAKRSVMYPAGFGQYSGGVGTLPGAQQNVLLGATPLGPAGIDFSAPSTWSWIWFGVAVLYLVGVYYAHGGRGGSAL